MGKKKKIDSFKVFYISYGSSIKIFLKYSLINVTRAFIDQTLIKLNKCQKNLLV